MEMGRGGRCLGLLRRLAAIYEPTGALRELCLVQDKNVKLPAREMSYAWELRSNINKVVGRPPLGAG